MTLILTGGLAGWIAAILVRGAGLGLVPNIIAGVIGGLLGGKLLAILGVGRGTGPVAWLAQLATAVVGATLLLSLLDLARRRRSGRVATARPARPHDHR